MSWTYLVELNDIWMSDYFQNVDFTSDAIYIWLILYLVLFKDFDGYFFTSDQMSSQSDLAESALSEWTAFKVKHKLLTNYVVTDCSICIGIGILRSTLSSLSSRKVTISSVLGSSILTITRWWGSCWLTVGSRGSFSVVFILLNRSIWCCSVPQRRCTSALCRCGCRRPSSSWILSVWHVICDTLAWMARVIMSIGGCIAISCTHSYTERIIILLE